MLEVDALNGTIVHPNVLPIRTDRSPNFFEIDLLFGYLPTKSIFGYRSGRSDILTQERAASEIPSCRISIFTAASTHALSELVNGRVADAFRALWLSPCSLVSVPIFSKTAVSIRYFSEARW